MISDVDCRLTARNVMEKIVSICAKEDDAYGQVDLVELINRADPNLLYDITPTKRGGSLRRRIYDFKVK